MPNTGRILVVDDDEAQIKFLATILEADGWKVLPALSGQRALDILDRGEEMDVILTDLLMPGMDGRQLLAAVQERRPEIPVIVMTAHASVDSAVELLHAGAHHYLEKPAKLAELRITVRRARDTTEARRELARLRRRIDVPSGVVALSRQMQEILDAALRVASTSTPVLITGETGTGKEVIARAIHAASGRASFVALNCAAIPPASFEAELFGARKGVPPETRREQTGALESANTGTLFLDEVAETPLSAQPRLVQWIEHGTFQSSGAAETQKSGARLIATMQRSPEDAVAARQMREDLFYHLSIVHLHIPPLRERPVDIPALALHLLGRLADRFQLDAADLAPEALAALTAYSWPGNARELENVLARAVALRGAKQLLGIKDLPPHIARIGGGGARAIPGSASAMLTLEEVERRHILHVLEKTGGNKLKAAVVLGIDRSTLHRKLKQIQGLAALQL
ncbi:MAG TPA: sigma-54 dependent transcriptional regulator [Gemmatimonadales bacterium]|jgi:DNA-binding NtrC family response regulator